MKKEAAHGCRVMLAGTQIVVVECDPWESYIRQLIADNEREWEDHEVEMCHDVNDRLAELEPEMFDFRAATDPHWPPPECDPYADPDDAPPAHDALAHCTAYEDDPLGFDDDDSLDDGDD